MVKLSYAEDYLLSTYSDMLNYFKSFSGTSVTGTTSCIILRWSVLHSLASLLHFYLG